jgi:hypothetical protein
MTGVKLPYFSIWPDRVSFYEKYSSVRPRDPEKSLNSLANLKKNKADPFLSEKAVKRIRTAVDWLLYLSKPKRVYSKKSKSFFKFKVCFITLTLSSAQIHSDREVREKCLHPFFIYARRLWGVQNYVWRAEKQRNGNIHFHVTIDKYVPWFELRDTWNRCQDNLGYVARYTARYKSCSFQEYCTITKGSVGKTFEAVKRAFEFGVNSLWTSPNSTDIHSVRSVRDLSAYLSKYLTKLPEHGAVTCDQWGLSRKLSRLKNITGDFVSGCFQEFSEFVSKTKTAVHHYDYAHIIYVHLWTLRQHCPFHVSRLIDDYVALKFT